MKTNRINTLARLTGMTIALAVFAGIGGLANAQEKGATRLLRVSGALVEPKSTPSDYKPMSCANCKDSFVAVRDTEVRGAGGKALVTSGSPRRIVAKHLCGSCVNEWVVKGHGKAKASVPIHKCASCG